MNHSTDDSDQSFKNSFLHHTSDIASVVCYSLVVHNFLYSDKSIHNGRLQSLIYSSFLCGCAGCDTCYNAYMNCKFDSSTFDRTRTKKNLSLILKISILLALVSFGIRFVQTDRPEIKSKGPVPLSFLKWIFVQKVRGSQVMMIMATNILWTTIESEVFRSQKKQGLIHWLLILPKFFGILLFIVQCHPKWDLQDGIIALAVLNILWALLIGYLLGKRNINETIQDLPTEDRSPGYNVYSNKCFRRLWMRPWNDDHNGGTSNLSSARSRAGPESPLLPRMPSV